MYSETLPIEEATICLLILKKGQLQERIVEFAKNSYAIQGFAQKVFLGDFVAKIDIYNKEIFLNNDLIPEYKKIFIELHNLLNPIVNQCFRYGPEVLTENTLESSPIRRLPIKMLANMLALLEQATQLIIK